MDSYLNIVIGFALLAFLALVYLAGGHPTPVVVELPCGETDG